MRGREPGPLWWRRFTLSRGSRSDCQAQLTIEQEERGKGKVRNGFGELFGEAEVGVEGGEGDVEEAEGDELDRLHPLLRICIKVVAEAVQGQPSTSG